MALGLLFKQLSQKLETTAAQLSIVMKIRHQIMRVLLKYRILRG